MQRLHALGLLDVFDNHPVFRSQRALSMFGTGDFVSSGYGAAVAVTEMRDGLTPIAIGHHDRAEVERAQFDGFVENALGHRLEVEPSQDDLGDLVQHLRLSERRPGLLEEPRVFQRYGDAVGELLQKVDLRLAKLSRLERQRAENAYNLAAPAEKRSGGVAADAQTAQRLAGRDGLIEHRIGDHKRAAMLDDPRRSPANAAQLIDVAGVGAGGADDAPRSLLVQKANVVDVDLEILADLVGDFQRRHLRHAPSGRAGIAARR